MNHVNHGTEYIENELKCPYCKNDRIINTNRLDGALIHKLVSCRNCGRNFEAMKKGDVYSIINGDER